MNYRQMIKKYGESATLNGVDVYVLIDEEKTSTYKKEPGFKAFTGSKMCKVLIASTITEHSDRIVIAGVDYRVFQAKGIKQRGKIAYTEATLFENDFTHDAKIYAQVVSLKGLNLPSKTETPYKIVKARLKTAKATDYTEYAFYGGKIPTHIISVMYEDGLKVGDLVSIGARSFEVLGTENIDERDVILVIDVIEVL